MSDLYGVFPAMCESERRNRNPNHLIYTYIYVCVCMRIYICVYIYMYIYIHTYITVYTYIHTYIHTYGSRSSRRAGRPLEVHRLLQGPRSLRLWWRGFRKLTKPDALHLKPPEAENSWGSGFRGRLSSLRLLPGLADVRPDPMNLGTA